jgi:phosphatidylglycerophosphatase A
LVLGTGFGFGYSPVAPGTVGSLWGLLLAWGLQQSGWSLWAQLVVIAVVFLVGIPICGRAARLLGAEDPGQVVFDEIAALPVVFLLIPIDGNIDVTTAIAGFAWFRLFDIAKPWPVRRLDQIDGGLGIMADDMAAALYAAGALWLTVWGFALLGVA